MTIVLCPARSRRKLRSVAMKPLPAISMKMASSRLRTGVIAANMAMQRAPSGCAPAFRFLVVDLYQRAVQSLDGGIEVGDVHNELNIDVTDLVLHRDYIDTCIIERPERIEYQAGLCEVA